MSPPRPHGFTLIELVAVMVLAGILAFVAMPRLADKAGFDAMGYRDGLVSALRYGQKAAIAQRRTVCVAVTAGSAALTVASAAGSAVCDTPLTLPGKNTNTLTAPSGVGTSTADFAFTPLGRPSAAQAVAVSGVTDPIVVEAETGYVH